MDFSPCLQPLLLQLQTKNNETIIFKPRIGEYNVITVGDKIFSKVYKEFLAPGHIHASGRPPSGTAELWGNRKPLVERD